MGRQLTVLTPEGGDPNPSTGMQEAISQFAGIWSSTKVSAIQAMIVKSFLVAGQTPPSDDLMVASIGAWAEVLEDIPSDRLDEYYKRATKRKANGYAVNALDIIAEWNRLTDQRRYDTYLRPEERGKY